jgi:pimeloyl-ACP methyl ester carboxylesterase
MIRTMRPTLRRGAFLLAAALLTGACAANPPAAAQAQAQAAFAPKTFSVQRSGSGRPVIFLPGLASSGAVWDSIAAELPGTEAHVLTLAGFAGVPAAGNRPMLESVAGEVAAYIRAHRLREPVVVGHSLGGTLALMIAAAEPELVGPLVVVDGLPYFPAAVNPAATPDAMRAQAGMMRDQVARQTREEFVAAQASYFPANVTHPGHLALVKESSARSDPATVGQAMYELLTTDVRPQLPRIRAPVLVFGSWAMYGNREQVLKNFQAQFAAVPGARIELSASGRHFLMYDDPAGLLRLVRDALAL